MSSQTLKVAGLPGIQVVIESKSIRNRKTADITVTRALPVRGPGADPVLPWLTEESYTANALIGFLEAGPWEKARVEQEIAPVVKNLTRQGWKVNVIWR